jgi:hypothetical protein
VAAWFQAFGEQQSPEKIQQVIIQPRNRLVIIGMVVEDVGGL